MAAHIPSWPVSFGGDRALSLGFSHHHTVVISPIKHFQVYRGSDLHLGTQTTALFRGEKQFSIPSRAGEGSGLLCVLIYSLSGQESCSRSFASFYT